MRTMVPTIYNYYDGIMFFLTKIKRLIQKNNDKESGQRGAKVSDSTIDGGKYYPLVHTGY